MKYIKLFERKLYEIKDFIDCMVDLYGDDVTFDYFQRHTLTRKIIKKYIYDYVEKRKRIGVWGGGDSFDREIFRDLLRFKLGLETNINELEYNITPYLTDLEIDVNKYNI